MLPTNLFVDAPEASDASMTHLSNEADTWAEQIIQKLKERVPEASTMNMMVKFQKQDPEMGVATGAVIMNSPEKAGAVPLVIKDFMLYPMDVFLADGKIFPLTPDFFKSVFSNNQMFGSLEEFPTYGGLGRFEEANLWNSIYPPSLGRYAYASAGYPILDALTDSIDGAEFGRKIRADEKIAARLYTNGHAPLAKKLAHLRPVNMNEFRQGVDKLVPKSVMMLRQAGPHRYELLSSGEDMFNPTITKMDYEQACGMCTKLSPKPQDEINDVDQNGEKFLKTPEGPGSAFLYEPETELPEAAESFGHFTVKNKNGVSFEGVVVPKVVDFDLKPMNFKMFLGKGMSTIQPEIWGVRLKNSAFKPKSSGPKVGQTGAFIYQPGDSDALALSPLTIEALYEDCMGVNITASDLMGRPIKLQLSQSEMGRPANVGGRYILPMKKMHWYPMEGFEQVTNSADDYLSKTAARVKTANPVTLIPTGYGQYSMKGVNKYAAMLNWTPGNLEGYQAQFLLGALGASPSFIKKAMKVASMKGHADIFGLKELPLKSEKIANLVPRAQKLTKIANAFKSDLIKEASYLENSQTVDALLSLNFINPENVGKFVQKIPQFKSAISGLASCLLASRVGMKEIPEQAASTAMTRLVEVVAGLERLKATQEFGEG